MSSTKFSIFLFFGSLFLFTCGLSHHEFTQFETRFAYFVQEIARHGMHFFPMLYGKPYPDYPATYPILMYVSSLIFGKITLFSTIWPSAINAAGTVVLTYRLGALQKISWGLAAVLFELATFYFFITARSLSLDQFVVFATTYSFYLVYKESVIGHPASRRGLPWLFLYGFIFRGPLGIILPLSVVLVFDFLNKNYKQGMKTMLMGMTLFLFSNAVLLYAAYLTGGISFLWEVAGMQGLSRIQQLGHYPVYFYFQQAFLHYALAFPIAVVVVCVCWRAIFVKHAKLDQRFLQYLIGWVGILLVGLSIPSGKKLRYILPITPAISLIASRFILDNSSWVLAQLRSLFLYCCFIFPVVGLLLVGATESYGAYAKMALGSHPIPAIIFLVWIFIAGYHVLHLWHEKQIRYNVKFAMGVGTFIVLMIFIAQPMHAYFNRTKPFAAVLDHYQLPGQEIVFYHLGPDAEDVKLMVALEQGDIPHFIQTEAALLAATPQALIVSKAQDYAQLSDAAKSHFLVLYRGNIGHQKAILLRSRP